MANKPKLTPAQKERLKNPKSVVAMRAVRPKVVRSTNQRKPMP